MSDSNINVYDYNGGQLLGTSIAFLILNTIFVILRFVARRSVSSKIAWDDYLVLGALLANLTLEPACIALVYVGGTGRHVEYWLEIEHTPGVLINWGKILLAVEQTYLLANLFAKLAILVMYVRIFTSRPTLYTTYTLMFIVTAAWFGSAIAGLLQCRPFWCNYDKSQPAECTCIDILAFFRYISLPNIITDAVMLILPLPTIWSLKLSRSQKLGLTGAFLMGSIGVVASCVRFAIFFSADALADPTWKSAFLNVWTVTEPSTYLIAACLPVLRPLLRKARGLRSSAGSNIPSRKSRTGFTDLSKQDSFAMRRVGSGAPHAAAGANATAGKGSSGNADGSLDSVNEHEIERELVNGRPAKLQHDGSRGGSPRIYDDSRFISVTNDIDVAYSMREDRVIPHR